MSGLRLTLFGSIDPAPHKAWLVKGVLGAGELSCIFGAPGSGKSALAGDMAVHVAASSAWLGHEVEGGAVLYVAAERAALVKRRFAACRFHYGWVEIPLGVVDGAIDLRSSAATADEIARHGREVADTFQQPLRLIVIDTVSRALNGGDENSPKDMGALVSHATALQRATGAHVCLVHHIPQDGTQRLRGHGSLLGAVDTSIGVEKGTTARVATVEKANDSEEGERLCFTLESVEIGEDTTAPVVVQADAPSRPAKQHRRLPNRMKNALDALTDLCVDGKPIANGHDLPASIRAVGVESWRDALYKRGVLDAEHSNPRADFQRVKDTLIARQRVAERNGQIWAV